MYLIDIQLPMPITDYNYLNQLVFLLDMFELKIFY